MTNPFFRSIDQSVERHPVRGGCGQSAALVVRSEHAAYACIRIRWGSLGGTGAVSMRHKQALLRLIRAAKANRHGGNLHHWREARLVDPHCGLCFARVRRVQRRCSCVLAKASRVQRLKGTLGYACGAPNGSKVGFRALASLRREAVDACERRREW